jgi:hypothetical protein
MNSVRAFLGLEAAAFAAASLVHRGVLLEGYQHVPAAIAESVIAAVLALGLAAAVMSPRHTRVAGLAAQGFALFGTFVGLTMMAIGVGPQSAFDVALHVGFVTVLVSGLLVTTRGHIAPSQPMSASRI